MQSALAGGRCRAKKNRSVVCVLGYDRSKKEIKKEVTKLEVGYGHTPDGYCALERVRELIDADREGRVLILQRGQRVEYESSRRIVVREEA